MSVQNLNESNFEAAINQGGVLVLDWWAPWCGPCRAFAPIFEQVATNHPEVTFAKINTEECRALGTAMQIRSIPTLMVFRDGILVFNQAGMLPKKALDEVVTKVAALDMEEVRKHIEEAKSTQKPLSNAG